MTPPRSFWANILLPTDTNSELVRKSRIEEASGNIYPDHPPIICVTLALKFLKHKVISSHLIPLDAFFLPWIYPSLIEAIYHIPTVFCGRCKWHLFKMLEAEGGYDYCVQYVRRLLQKE